MSNNESNSLEFVPTTDLIEELVRRSNAVVFSAMLKTDELTNGDGVTFRYEGGCFTAIGMMTDAIERIRTDLQVIHKRNQGADE